MGCGSLYGGGAVVLGSDCTAGSICGGAVGLGSGCVEGLVFGGAVVLGSCSSVRITSGGHDESSAWDGWSLMPHAAKNSSILLIIRSDRSTSASIFF